MTVLSTGCSINFLNIILCLNF